MNEISNLFNLTTRYFYEGDGAELILNTVGQQGLITRDCLSQYTVVERQPLKSQFRGKTIYTNPAPATGGTLITFALQLMDQSDRNSKFDFTNLVKATQMSSTARRDFCHDMKNEMQNHMKIKCKLT